MAGEKASSKNVPNFLFHAVSFKIKMRQKHDQICESKRKEYKYSTTGSNLNILMLNKGPSGFTSNTLLMSQKREVSR